MFKTAEMQKIRVIGLRNDLPAIIQRLHELGEVDFRKIGETYFEPGAPLDNFAEVSEQLVRLRAVEQMLPKPKAHEPIEVPSWRDAVQEARTMGLDRQLLEIKERLEEIRKKRNESKNAFAILSTLAPLDIDFSKLKSALVGVVAGKIATAKLGALQKGLQERNLRMEMQTEKLDRDHVVMAIAYDRREEQLARDVLAQSGFSEINLEKVNGKPARLAENVLSMMAELEMQQKGLEAEFAELSEKNYSMIVALREALEIEEQRCTIAQKFGRSAQLFSFEGWIVKEKLGFVEKELARITNSKLHIHKIHVPHGHAAHSHGSITHIDKAPTLLINPRPLAPFESLIKFLSLPGSDELDPTPIFSVTFPLIYGMMVGDVGYGLASMFIAYFLMRKFKAGMLNAIAKAWMYAAVPAILFGIIFNEWFGFTLEHLLGAHAPLYPALRRLENTSLLLGLVILFGAVHIAFGFILGAINAWREGAKWHAVAKASWVGVQIGGTLAILTYMFAMFPPVYATVGIALAAVCLGLVVKGEGLLGIPEVAGVAGNTLSYARVMAVGVAGVVIAEEIINKTLVPTPAMGLMAIPVGILFVVAHLLNLVLAMFESLVQGTRLNFIEFFSKFYHGGGIPFTPFAMKQNVKQN